MDDNNSVMEVIHHIGCSKLFARMFRSKRNSAWKETFKNVKNCTYSKKGTSLNLNYWLTFVVWGESELWSIIMHYMGQRNITRKNVPNDNNLDAFMQLSLREHEVRQGKYGFSPDVVRPLGNRQTMSQLPMKRRSICQTRESLMFAMNELPF